MSVFVLLFGLNFFAQADSIACSHPAPIHYFANGVEDLLRKYEVLQFEEDAHTYCDKMMMRRFVEAHLGPDGNSDGLSDQEVDQKADQLIEKEGAGGFVALPRKSYVETVAKEAILLPNDETGKSFSDSLQSALKTIESKAPCSLPSHDGQDLKALGKQVGEVGTDDTWPIQVTEKIGAPVICGELVSLVNNLSCSKAFNRNVEAIRQRGVPPLVSMPHLFDRVINSGVYDRGLAIMAKNMVQSLKSPEHISSNIFSDLKNSYKKAGYGDRVAEKLTFDTMGVIATAGPALQYRLKHLSFSADRWPIVTALTTIAGLLPMLDYYSSNNGNLYSYPPGVTGTCNTSKSYHFWMAAYLSRNEAVNGTPSEVAAAAAYSVSKLYPVLGNLTNRGGAGYLFLHRPFSPASMIVRMDLAYASAGAVFGAGGTAHRKLDVDQGIKSLINGSGVLPRLSVEEAIAATRPWKLFGYTHDLNKYILLTKYLKRTQKIEIFSSQPRCTPKITLNWKL